jgi:transposase
MIGLPRGLAVFMYGEPVDMRKSFNTLSALVAHEMKRDLLEGDLFLFVGRDRKRAKVLYFDGTERAGAFHRGQRSRAQAAEPAAASTSDFGAEGVD